MDSPLKPLHSPGKALYLLLCAVLGALLFIVIHRAASLVYYLLLNSNYDLWSFGLSEVQLQAIDYLTLFAGLILGLWYGIWLGLHWYDIVYVQGTGGVFHHFKLPARAPVVASTVKMTDRVQSKTWDLEDLMAKKVYVKTKVVRKRRVVAKKP